MSDIQDLIERIQKEAQKESFPIDIPVYKSAKKDPTEPILYFGNLKSNLCFFGRDLGKDEVMAGQPLIGAAGTLVRQGFYQAIHQQKTSDKNQLASVGDRLILTNTVPYKPPGNKAYSAEVKARFRPFMEQLLVIYWQGNQIITLGTEAFKWFAPYGERGEVNQFWTRSDRYQSKLAVTLRAIDARGNLRQKAASLYPLPHPSPLNQQYYAKFPEMLQYRLSQLAF